MVVLAAVDIQQQLVVVEMMVVSVAEVRVEEVMTVSAAEVSVAVDTLFLGEGVEVEARTHCTLCVELRLFPVLR